MMHAIRIHEMPCPVTDPAVLLSDHRVETCSNENNELRRKVENLECTNK